MNKEKIKQGLSQLGVVKGDVILLHSSLASLGKVEGGADAVIDAFTEAVGPEGTFAVPVFGALGVITEIMHKRPGVVVSSCPVGTVAAIGAKAAELCADHWKADTAHGKDTPYAKLAAMGGKVCLLGVDQDRNTFLHGIEARLQLAYLGETTRTFDTPEGESVTRTYRYYPGPHRDFIGLDHQFKAAGIMKQLRIGNAEVRMIDAAGMLKLGLELGKADPAFVLCDNPACPACVKQRAELAEAQFATESFRLSISSRLAGRYVPEMIENIQAAGIRFVELDFIQGVAADRMPPEKLAAVTAEFREAGIEISALRVFAAPENTEKLVNSMAAAGIDRLILPLCSSAAASKAAAAAGIGIDFFNSNHTTASAIAAYHRRVDAIGACGICFNPAGFAAAGENPFTSYRAGRFIKTIRQLDVNDALHDGTPARPARGNGEIKELISILRCANFSGFMVLGGGTLPAGTPGEIVADFHRMLATC